MKAMNFQDDIPSIPIDNFKDHYILVFDLTSMQDAAENCHYPELVGEQLRLDLDFTFVWKTLLSSMYWENECLRLQLISLVLLGKTSKMENVFLQQILNSIPLLKNRWFSSIQFDSTDNDTFAIVNTQASKMQVEHWIFNANSCQNSNFADSLGRITFLQQQYKHMMPTPLRSHPSVCGFYRLCSGFHLFKFRQKEITGVHKVNVPSFISNYM